MGFSPVCEDERDEKYLKVPGNEFAGAANINRGWPGRYGCLRPVNQVTVFSLISLVYQSHADTAV